jgi:uncharacterized protein YeaO (DUF488 family)
MLQIKRVYEEAETKDGFRVLVDRLWPRGLSKEKAKVDLWLKEIAPSTELRTWFHKHGTEENFEEFADKYETELKSNSAVQELQDLIKQHKTITLLYGSRETNQNHAKVLVEFMRRQS